ncbi:GNAT family N-acetyltransferase [Streptomyces chartreusis]|uniref:GNAT family N-acetyltransferase n=1 Tax=Streptomyces chartreusis TaxID=1969 RepID=UPI0036BA0BEA
MTRRSSSLTDTHDSSLRALLISENWHTHAASLIDDRHRPWERIYVALLDGEVVGFVEGTFSDMSAFTSGEFPPPRARIMNLLVSSARRRNRVGSGLVQRFAADAQAMHLDGLVLFPDPREPEERMAFFADCGLRPVIGSELLGASLESIRTALTEPAT